MNNDHLPAYSHGITRISHKINTTWGQAVSAMEVWLHTLRRWRRWLVRLRIWPPSKAPPSPHSHDAPPLHIHFNKHWEGLTQLFWTWRRKLTQCPTLKWLLQEFHTMRSKKFQKHSAHRIGLTDSKYVIANVAVEQTTYETFHKSGTLGRRGDYIL